VREIEKVSEKKKNRDRDALYESHFYTENVY